MAMERDVTLFPQAYSAEACYPHYYFHVGVQDFCRDLPLVKVADRSCKCVFVGDSAVGKTSLINRFVRNFFIKDYKLTIGVDFDVQSFNILGVPFHFQIWDTAGLERFQCITSSYYRSSNIVAIVFDMSNMSTLASVRRWHEQIVKSTSDSEPLIFLVGSKVDLMCESAFDFVEGEAIKLAKELQVEYWSVSSLSGSMVDDLFTRMAVLTFQQLIQREIQPPTQLERPVTFVSHGLIKLKEERRCKKIWRVLCKSS